MGRDDISDWLKADKKQLLAALLPALKENEALRDSVTRLMHRPASPPAARCLSHEDDFVPGGWAERYGIAIPRADGYFESEKAWVRITHGVITNAGIKNQSILLVMIARKLLDESADLHASLYMDWRAAFFARIEAARYSDVGSGDPEAWSKEDRFSKLLKAVERKYLRYVDMIVAGRPKEKQLESLNNDPVPFRESFEVLERAIRRINQEADDALQAKRTKPAAINFQSGNIACI